MSDSSRITVAAGDLLGLLTVCSYTAARPTAGDRSYPSIYLETSVGELGDEPGATTMLTGISADGVVYGTTSITAVGEFDRPWLVPADIRSVVSPFLSRLSKQDNEAEVSLTVHSSGRATLAYVDDETDMYRFQMESAEEWPLHEAVGMITGEAAQEVISTHDGDVLEAGARMAFNSAALATMAKVSKHVGVPMSVIRVAHPASVLLLECGEWRGALTAEQYPEYVPVDEPYTELPEAIFGRGF